MNEDDESKEKKKNSSSSELNKEDDEEGEFGGGGDDEEEAGQQQHLQHSVLNNIDDKPNEESKKSDSLVLTVDRDEDDDENSRIRTENDVKTTDTILINDSNDYSSNINLNMNNLDLKTNARSKFDDDDEARIEVTPSSGDAQLGSGNSVVVRRSGRLSSSSSIEDNSKSVPESIQVDLTSCGNGNSVVMVTSSEEFVQTSNYSPKSVLHDQNEDSDELVHAQAYLWTDTEALLKQHEQTGSSACGATAILNVLVKKKNFFLNILSLSKLYFEFDRLSKRRES